MSYQNNLKKRHKETLYLALIIVVVLTIVAIIDKVFNLGLIE
jgi:hypothetical protein